MEGNVEKLRQSSVSIHTPYTVASLDELEDGKLGLTLKKAKSDEEEQLAVDDLIVNYGFVSDAKILASWGLEMNRKTLVVDQNQQTSIPGVYAIGDIASRPGKINLIATGFGEAPNAVNNALVQIYPEKKQPTHSTQLNKNFESLNN